MNIQLSGSFSGHACLFFKEIFSMTYKECRWVMAQAVVEVNFPPTTISGTEHQISNNNQHPSLNICS